MDRNRRPSPEDDRHPDRPGLAGQDWEAIEAGAIEPEEVFENGDIRYHDEPTGELPGEDDDNPYQESDEALPDSDEEQAIDADVDKTGGRPDRS